MAKRRFKAPAVVRHIAAGAAVHIGLSGARANEEDHLPGEDPKRSSKTAQILSHYSQQ